MAWQGEANGKPHWSKTGSGSEQHIYWAPDGKRQWLLRSRFTPDKQICSAYHEDDDLRTGPSNWKWAKDKTWVTHPLTITQSKTPASQVIKSDGASGGAAGAAAEANAARESRMTRLRLDGEEYSVPSTPGGAIPITGIQYQVAGSNEVHCVPIPATGSGAVELPGGLEVFLDPASLPPNITQVRTADGRTVGGAFRNDGKMTLDDVKDDTKIKSAWMPVEKSLPPQDQPPKLGGIFKQYSNGVSSQLGPFLSDDLSWMDTDPNDVLTRAPPIPFGTFESLSKAVVDVDEVGGGGGALILRRYKITLYNSEGQRHTIERTWQQVHFLVDAVRTSGDPGTEDLKRLEPSESDNERRLAVRVLKVSEALYGVLKKYPTAVELHAFLGWGAQGEDEVGTVHELRRRKFDVVNARLTAKKCKETMDKRVADAESVAADEEEHMPVRETLQVLKMSELRKRAISVGINERTLEEYYDLDQPKVAIVDAILEAWEDPRRLTRVFLQDANKPKAVLVSGTGMAWVDGVYFQVGVHGSFPYYQNKDEMILCGGKSAEGESAFPWKIQRERGAAECFAYLDRCTDMSGVPVGGAYWWCNVPQLPNQRLAVQWVVRYATITALRDDAGEYAEAAALFPDFFRVPKLGSERQQETAQIDDRWAHADKFLTPSTLRDAPEPVQFGAPVLPFNDYTVPQTGGLIAPNMFPKSEKWGELSLDEACRLAKAALTEGHGIISLAEGLQLVAG